MEETAAVGVGAVFVQGLVGYLITIVVALATAGMIAVMVRSLRAFKPAASKPAEAVPSVLMTSTVDEAEIARRVAVVAAAVATVAGRTRIVQIGEAPVPGLWRTTGRAMHHRSHTPHR
jgi:hypothetical protein